MTPTRTHTVAQRPHTVERCLLQSLQYVSVVIQLLATDRIESIRLGKMALEPIEL